MFLYSIHNYQLTKTRTKETNMRKSMMFICIFCGRGVSLMFITQVMKIGDVIESKTDYQTLVDNQKKYNQKYFINVILDPENNFEIIGKIQPEEYEEEKIYEYGFGISTGSGALFSPSFNIKWEDIKDQKLYDENIDNFKTVINFNKLFLMVSKSNQEIDDKHVTQFINFLKDPESPFNLRKQIVQKLFQEFVQKGTSNKDRPMRILFSFKVKKDNTEKILFPGQIDGFKEWYISLANASMGSSSKNKQLCHVCNKVKEIGRPFNTGFFTLDQASFSIGFTGKKSNQYQVCKDCYSLCNRGFNFVEDKLNFYAYKYKKGRDDIRVYHYLVPIATNPDIIKEAIKQVSRVKYQLNQNRKILTENRIKALAEGLRRADKKQKKVLTDRINKMKEEMKKYENNTNISFDINELLEQLKSTNLSFLDIFYIVSDNKQNPTVKEIVDVIIIKKERIQFLAENILKVKQEYGLNSLRFNDLNYLVGDKQFINILASFLSGGKINNHTFEKFASKNIKQAFKDKYFKKDKSSYFSKKIETFQVMYSLFQESENFKIGG